MKQTVVLLNLGGPNSLSEVRPFLFKFFNDPAILRMGALPRFFLALLISTLRAKPARANYAKMGGKSPLLDETRAQAQALEAALNANGGSQTRCLIAMRYGFPSTRDAMRELEKDPPDRIVLLPLYPQYSTTTTQSSFDACALFLKKNKIPVRTIRSYPEAAGWIDCLVEEARLGLAQNPKARILLSAHGLPESIVQSGDPYVEECRKTFVAFKEKLNAPEMECVLCFQSRVGPQKWTKPSLLEEIERAGNEGKGVIVVPIAFVSEHVETLIELDEEARDYAKEKGVSFWYRAETARTKPAFIEALARLVTQQEAI